MIRLTNASRVGKTAVSMPYSRMKQAVAETLAREGYVGQVAEKGKAGRMLEVELRYSTNGRPVISGTKRVSKPSRRMYLGTRDLHPIKRGYGLQVLSTPAGILTGKEARQKRLGGEILFEVW